MVWIYIVVFILSCILLSLSGSRLIKSLINISKFLGWREFVVAFFIMSFATSIPNLFVDINAALQHMPQLAFGDIVGGNIADLTLVLGLAVLFGSISLPAESKMVQTSAIFTTVIASLPLLLMLDGKLGRIDGLILLASFAIYSLWLFSKEDRFRKIYNHQRIESPMLKLEHFLKDIVKVVCFSALLLLASEGIVVSAQAFSGYFNIGLPFVGMLIVGLGNVLPETYFSIASARKEQNWMILGNLMGSVIVCATLVLGIVVLINPIELTDPSPFIIARIFTIIALLFFLIAVRTGEEITKREGLMLFLIYILFFITEIVL